MTTKHEQPHTGIRILCLIPNLGGGGAERVMCDLAGHWVGRGHELLLVTTEPHVEDFYRPDERVRRLELTPAPVFGNKSLGRVTQARALRQVIRSWKPHVLVSFLTRTNLIAAAATWRLDVPVIASERDDPRTRPFSRGRSYARRKVLQRAHTVVGQTQGIVEWASGELGAKPRVVLIPNLVDPPLVERERNTTFKTVTAMGRLHEQKGFDLLLEAFSLCLARLPGWRLRILGEGPERSRLEALARSNRIDGAVDMPGLVENPQRWLVRSDLFAFPSRGEGFGLALAEAMACGIPPVSFDCHSGPGDLIRHGVDGFLVPPGDVDAFADAMVQLMEDEGLRHRLGRRATDVVGRFSRGEVMDRWDSLLSAVTRVTTADHGRPQR